MTCSVDNCERPVKYKGMCGMHYKRWWRHGNPLATFAVQDPQNAMICSVEDCDNPIGDHGAKGYCPAHYSRMHNYERLERVIASKGDGTKDANGYRLLTINGERVLEHRHLAAKALGKPLPPGVVVHHTGARDDNHGFFKLVICPDQTYHMLLHARARELGYENN